MSGVRTIGGGGTAAPAGDADIIWAETPRYRDALKPTMTLPDRIVFRDVHRQNPLALNTTTRFTSLRVVPAVAADYPEPLKLRETFIGRIDDLKVARTGTPDSDHLGDAWTDGVPIRNGDNHGNESPLPCSGNLLSATTTYPWFKWNLTTPRFVGLAHRAGVGTCRFSFWGQQALAIAQSLNVNISVKTTNPFTESTINFTNQPTLGTNQVTRTISILVGAVNGRYDIDLSAAEFAPFIGNWMLVRMDSAAVLATAINIVSREGASAERPLLSFDFTKS